MTNQETVSCPKEGARRIKNAEKEEQARGAKKWGMASREGKGELTVILRSLGRGSLNGDSWSIAMVVRHAPRSRGEEKEAGESE
jgi:hypothetical protein